MWDNGIKDNPATPVDEHQVLMAFGDTFSGTGQTGIWRMNTLLRSSDHVLSNGMAVADGSTTDPFAGAPLASANLSKQIIGSPGYAVGSEVTIITIKRLKMQHPAAIPRTGLPTRLEKDGL